MHWWKIGYLLALPPIYTYSIYKYLLWEGGGGTLPPPLCMFHHVISTSIDK